MSGAVLLLLFGGEAETTDREICGMLRICPAIKGNLESHPTHNGLMEITAAINGTAEAGKCHS